MNHYFIDDPSLPNDYKTFSYYFGEHKFTFTSNSGLFSPGHVDEASSLLLHTLPPLSGRVLDLGCGYGPIGIVLAKVYPIELVMSDINGRALECAEKNCEQNGVQAKIVLSNSFQDIEGKFDAVVLNPPIHAGKQAVFELYEGAASHLTEEGSFYIVIQEKHGAKSSIKRLEELFGSVEVLLKKKGVYILAARL